MARGKYASKAAATKAREEALASADRMRHQVEAQGRELARERDAHRETRASLESIIMELREKLADKVNPEIARLSAENERLTAEAADARRVILEELRPTFNMQGVLFTPEAMDEVARVFRVSSGEFIAQPYSNRSTRRAKSIAPAYADVPGWESRGHTGFLDIREGE